MCLTWSLFLPPAYIVIGSAVNVMMIYVGRVLGGLCVGLLTLTLPVYLSETVQPEIRGILGLLPTTFGNAGEGREREIV